MSSEEKDKENKEETEEKKTPKEVINKIFSETNVTVILWFITIYLLLMRTLGLFRQDDISVQVKCALHYVTFSAICGPRIKIIF